MMTRGADPSLFRPIRCGFDHANVLDPHWLRWFAAAHAYRAAGVYSVEVTLKRAGRAVASATTTVHARASFGRAVTLV